MLNKTVWVVTCEYNDHDHYLEYVKAAYVEKPTFAELADILEDSDLADHLLSTGGGRRYFEDEWYWLREVQSGVRY